MRTVYLVFQDCPLCGDKGKARKIEIADVAKYGIKVEKLSFASKQGSFFCSELVLGHKAKGVGLPFYTDGETYTNNLMDFIELPIEQEAQKVRTPRKRKNNKRKK